MSLLNWLNEPDRKADIEKLLLMGLSDPRSRFDTEFFTQAPYTFAAARRSECWLEIAIRLIHDWTGGVRCYVSPTSAFQYAITDLGESMTARALITGTIGRDAAASRLIYPYFEFRDGAIYLSPVQAEELAPLVLALLKSAAALRDVQAPSPAELITCNVCGVDRCKHGQRSRGRHCERCHMQTAMGSMQIHVSDQNLQPPASVIVPLANDFQGKVS